jgi:hypothetical protein
MTPRKMSRLFRGRKSLVGNALRVLPFGQIEESSCSSDEFQIN